MLLQITHFSCRFSCENTPPTSNVRAAIQGASRRRRARFVGGIHHTMYAVQHAKHKHAVRRQPTLISIDLPRSAPEVAMPDIANTSAVSVRRVFLPRCLSRPVSFQKITTEKISSIAPELANTSLHYIRGALERFGPAMLKVLAGVKANPVANVIPKELSVVVNDLSSDMPTHMLAVYSRQVPAAPKCHVTLFPVHNVVFSTHCANLPILTTPNVVRPDTPGSTISIPVVPLCIPAPEVFHHLVIFLYTKRIDYLLAVLLPRPVPHPTYRGDPTSEAVLGLVRQSANQLARSFTAQALMKHAMSVNGVWRNACALGINDAKLWCALDVAWEVLIIALAVSTGRRL